MPSALTLSLLDRRHRALEAAAGPAPPAPPARSEIDRAIRAAAGRSPAPASALASPAGLPARAVDGGAREHSSPPRPPDLNAQMNAMIRAAAAQVGGASSWTVG